MPGAVGDTINSFQPPSVGGRRRVFQLVALTAAWVCSVHAASTAPLLDLWRPLAVLVAVGTIVAALSLSLDRRGPAVSALLAIVWLVAIGALIYGAILAVVEIWTRWLTSRRSNRDGQLNEAIRDRLVEAIAVAALIVGAASVLTSGVVYAIHREQVGRVAVGPNIYLVLLDGYPADATLRDSFHFNNGGFQERLQALGFQVRTDARSNYDATLTTLTSVFAMAYLADIPALDDPPASPQAQVRLLSRTLNGAPAFDILEQHGYTTNTIASWYGEGVLSRAEVVMRPPVITLFEEQFARQSPVLNSLIAVWPEPLIAAYRSAAEDTLAKLAESGAERTAGPKFTFVHVFAPHPPFGFGAGEWDRPAVDCYPRRCALAAVAVKDLGVSFQEYRQRFAANLTAINSLVLGSLDQLVATDPTAVVVLFSDHGARFEAQSNPEHFSTMLAARTPGNPDVVADIRSNVDILPVLFDAYLGEQVVTHEYRAWESDPRLPLVFEEVGDP